MNNNLYRSRKDKVIAGVCGGLAEHMDVDPLMVRIATVVLTLFTGMPILLYIAAMIFVPLEPENKEPVEKVDESNVSQNKQVPEPNMEDQIRILGILYISFGILWVMLAALMFLLLAGTGLITGDAGAITITTIVGILIAGIFFLISIPGIIGGIGLLKHQNWARILVLVLGFINLIQFPMGTALGIYTIWVLNHKKTNEIFEAK